MTSFDQLMKECDAAKDDIVTWRRHIHQNPELSFQEHNTVAYIRSVLESFACPQLTLTNLRPTALVGNLKGGAGEGPIIALRADIDALPLDEAVDVPFKSTKKGVMHACGHDFHTTMLLGAAKVLCAHVHEIKGSVRFIFQHAEEVPPGGAVELMKAGVMDSVKCIFGMHVAPEHPYGMCGLKDGAQTSCPDSLTVRVRGRGGHASTPQNCIDPVPIAAEVVTALQTIVARKIDPKLEPVISIATMTTGPNESHNVIPDEVKLLGTIRSQDHGVRDAAEENIKRIVKGVCEAHGATWTVNYHRGYDMVVNDPALAHTVRGLARKVFQREDAVIELKHAIYAGEDFSAYLAAAPGCFLHIGTGGPEVLNAPPKAGAHTVNFCPDERALPKGASMHVAFIYEQLMA